MAAGWAGGRRSSTRRSRIRAAWQRWRREPPSGRRGRYAAGTGYSTRQVEEATAAAARQGEAQAAAAAAAAAAGRAAAGLVAAPREEAPRAAVRAAACRAAAATAAATRAAAAG